MVDRLGFTDSHANLTWGAFTALVYAAPSIGGWIGDKVLGARRTMIIGAAVLCAGYLMLSVPNDQLTYMYASLGVIVVGNGLFKANAANLVRRIYETTTRASTARSRSTTWRSTSARRCRCSRRRGSGSLGLARRVRGLLRRHAARDPQLHADASHARARRLAAGRPADPLEAPRRGRAGRCRLALITLYVLQHKQLAVASVWTAAFAILAIFAYMIAKSERSERAGLIAALVLIGQVILFFIFYVQMSTSLTLFALRNVDPRFMLFDTTLFTWSAAQFRR